MVFSSIPFLFYFLPVLLLAYFAVPARQRGIRNWVLLVGSLIFYAWGEGVFLGVILVSIAINHICGQLIHRQVKARKIPLLATGILFNLGLLFAFKYAGFFSSILGVNDWQGLHLPLGISFFTFQAISYLVDIYRGHSKPAKTLRDTALYIALFAQLIAGPIVRFQSISDELHTRSESVTKFLSGTRLFILGLAQKVLIADVLAVPADQFFSVNAADLTMTAAWAGAICYALQIFFDFAGYSNMAIGLGLIVGFSFPRNFNYPYAATSVTEFWHRWHMSLSSWFRDYLYIPLGGNRKGLPRTILHLWIVFLLCGLWHGASWNFIFWGALHGFLLSIERFGLAKIVNKFPRIFQHIYLLFIVICSWVLFRAETLPEAVAYYRAMFTADKLGFVQIDSAIANNLPIWIFLAIVLSTPILEKALQRLRLTIASSVVQFSLQWIGLIGLLLMSFMFVAGTTYSPFIYFRF